MAGKTDLISMRGQDRGLDRGMNRGQNLGMDRGMVRGRERSPLLKPIHVDDLEQVLQATAPLWEDMRGQHLFITGGTGFFGCWLLETFCHANRCLSLNARVTVLTRSPARFSEKMPHVTSDPCVSLLAGDVRDFAFPSGEYRYVLHAATEASARQAAEQPMAMLGTILDGTRRTLEFAASHGAARFLLTSSGAVYGRQPSDIIHLPESYAGAPDPLDPAAVYGEGKRAAELMCTLFAQATGMECAIARCWAFCGPHLPLDTHFAIGNFIRDAMAGGPIRVSGDGTAQRSYLYAADLAIWLWTMLFRAPSLVACNVGSAQSLSILELARAVASVIAPEAAIEVARSSPPGAPPARYVPAVDRAKRILGLEQIVSLEEGIRRTAAWYSGFSTLSEG